jgi:hypothetical protein
MPSKLVRRVGIRLFELGVLYGVLGVLTFLLIRSIEVAWPMLYGMVLPLLVLITVSFAVFHACVLPGSRRPRHNEDSG